MVAQTAQNGLQDYVQIAIEGLITLLTAKISIQSLLG
jgi:hypothetical protein